MVPDESQHAGGAFLLAWVNSVFAGDEYARAATRRALVEVRPMRPPRQPPRTRPRLPLRSTACCLAPPPLQLAVFYALILVGFLALYCTWRSNTK